MEYTQSIVELYSTVFERQKEKFHANPHDIREAIKNMKEVYLPNPDWESEFASKVANYNNAAHRCAYLHKYAMLHTGLVCQVLQTAFETPQIKSDINSKNKLNLCSLGGGPGSDIVGLLFVLDEVFGFIQCSVSVIDYAQEWKHVFQELVSELRTGHYGSVNALVSQRYFSYEYLSANLLTLSPYNNYKVYSAITNADIITMIKFISAAACEKTRQMVKKIFQTMKSGAMLLFIDNAAGGFHNMIQDVAFEQGMRSVFGPVKHFEYEEPSFSRKLYGFTSQSKTKVVIEMWKKPHVTPYNTTQQLRQEYMYYGESSGRPRVKHNIRLNRPVEEEASNDSGCCSII